MDELVTIRTLGAHEWRSYRDVRLRSLADAPEAFCQTLAEAQALHPEVWASRLTAAAVSGRDLPLVAEAGAPVGLLYAKVDGDDESVVNLFQVWVAPEARGRGVAAMLLREALRWARARKARAVHLSVTCGDTPAARLYLREGFVNVGAPTPRTGTALMEQAMRLTLE